MSTSVSIFDLFDIGGAPAANDVTVVVDVSDTTQSPQGSTKKMLISELFTSVSITTSLAVTGTAAVSGNFAVNTDKFTVLAASGNTTVAGTLVVTGDTTATANMIGDAFKMRTVAGFSFTNAAGTLLGTWDHTTGTLAVSPGGLSVAGNVAVNTNKFTVAAATGNTLVAGTLAVSGNTLVAGTLGVTSDVAVNTNKFNVTASSGNTAIAGTLAVTGTSTLSSTLTLNATAQLGRAAGNDLITIGGTGYGAGTPSIRLNGLLSGAAAQAATLTNAPLSGDPNFWIPININGVVRYIPAW